ncbi:Transmembrane transcriptional regulator (anti-sigma factor RsiW) [Rhizobium sp. RU20A]|uniref:anti-sigma factor family protein n=1 Tax=Rhizobium sp. RU20A TaxID=1907412 RepID=UPI00095400D9|nr:anti-sigma factor [Rhizobium sp. RU20A]SIQ27237.1 Transmembrane transcriptional regulator (anti-sigma factor RsiW) [Rhizobium sp. RU20A]
MLNTRGLALEVRLSAYLDGELGDQERKELDDLLTRSDEARHILDTLKSGSAFGNTAFDDFLKDPVPLNVVRRIKQGSASVSPATERVVEARTSAARTKIWPRALAASLALLLVGGTAGYIIGSKQVIDIAPAQTATAVSRGWLDEIADYHRIYASQRDHMVELDSDEKPQIESWLNASVGVPFRIPDLANRGLAFQGARLLVVQGKPVAQLMYRDQEGDVIGFCFLRNTENTTVTDPKEDIRDDLALISWKKPGASFVIVGPSSDASLQTIAADIAQDI